MAQYTVSKETQDKIASFELADSTFRKAWDDFEQQAKQFLDYLDKLREDRNVKLDEAVRSLRTEADAQPITSVKTIKAGPFSVQKKQSMFFIPERFLAILKEKGLYDKARDEGAVVEVTEVPYSKAKQFVHDQGVEDSFAAAEDGKELTPAVSGPKPIPPFGVEGKERK
ncbi:MAG: hypothetical protein LUQ37_04530 [Methanoregulaceae archaeon]|jgi:hypothetical protein|nr:hypothetical protein [Methanoregulaceae archaeon]